MILARARLPRQGEDLRGEVDLVEDDTWTPRVFGVDEVCEERRSTFGAGRLRAREILFPAHEAEATPRGRVRVGSKRVGDPDVGWSRPRKVGLKIQHLSPRGDTKHVEVPSLESVATRITATLAVQPYILPDHGGRVDAETF